MDDPTRFQFNKEKLLALPLPAAGARATYRDTKTTGLQLRVTSTGVRTFSMYRRTKGGGPERVTLGRFPAMTVEQARKAASTVNAEIENGGNPAELKRVLKSEPTFAEMFKEYGERHGTKKRSWTTDQSLYANHLQSLTPRKLTVISRAIISRILSDLEREGKAGATINNVRALVSSIYGRAIEWGYATANPVMGIRTRAKVKRDRFLQADELPRFFQSLAEEQNETLRDYILLALLTGARRANLLAMRWAETNLADSVWRIPDTKNGTPQNVTLSPEAVTILQARRDAAQARRCVRLPWRRRKRTYRGAEEGGHSRHGAGRHPLRAQRPGRRNPARPAAHTGKLASEDRRIVGDYWHEPEPQEPAGDGNLCPARP